MKLALFSIGHERGRWLASRAAAMANNVANADTPGYKARDVAPFEVVMKSAATGLGMTQAGHFPLSPGGARSIELVDRPGAASKHSGNTVSLEAEMAALGETRSQQSEMTAVLGAFHRMLLSSVKG